MNDLTVTEILLMQAECERVMREHNKRFEELFLDPLTRMAIREIQHAQAMAWFRSVYVPQWNER